MQPDVTTEDPEDVPFGAVDEDDEDELEAEQLEASVGWSEEEDQPPGERDETMRRDAALAEPPVAQIAFVATVKATSIPPAHDKPIVLQLAIPRAAGLHQVLEIAELGAAELSVTVQRRQPVFGERNGFAPVATIREAVGVLNGRGEVLAPSEVPTGFAERSMPPEPDEDDERE